MLCDELSVISLFRCSTPDTTISLGIYSMSRKAKQEWLTISTRSISLSLTILII